MHSTVDDAPSTRFVNKILQDAIHRGAERVHFERRHRSDWIMVKSIECGEERVDFEERPGSRGDDDQFLILMEFDGTFQEVAAPPLALWERIVSRLKVLARMVDYGPNKSVGGYFTLPVGEKGSAEFYMTSNPNPFSDSEVMLVCKGITSK